MNLNNFLNFDLVLLLNGLYSFEKWFEFHTLLQLPQIHRNLPKIWQVVHFIIFAFFNIFQTKQETFYYKIIKFWSKANFKFWNIDQPKHAQNFSVRGHRAPPWKPIVIIYCLFKFFELCSVCLPVLNAHNPVGGTPPQYILHYPWQNLS